MKRDTLIEIILGTVGGLVFAIGMCMCLMPEWNLFKAGVITAIIGFVLLLCIIPIYRKEHPKKSRGPINWELITVFGIGIIGLLLMGFGMSKIMVGIPETTDMIVGLITGVIGLLICVLNYPIYTYIKSNKE